MELPQSVIDAAKKEGKVVYYSSEVKNINDAAAAEFEKKYGIKVEVLKAANPELQSRYSSEKQANQVVADVLRLTDDAIFAQNPDWFVKLDSSYLPALQGFTATDFADQDRSVSSQFNAYSINYNTDLVKSGDAPKTWDDLLKPAFTGKIALADTRTDITWVGWADAMQTAKGADWLKKFGEQKPTIIDTATDAAQQVAAGSYALAVPQFPAHITPLKAKGAPVATVVPTDPALLKPDHIAVSQDAPHPNAARLFANFRLSREFLSTACGLNVLVSPVDGVSGCEEMPANPVIAKGAFTDQEEATMASEMGLPPAK